VTYKHLKYYYSPSRNLFVAHYFDCKKSGREIHEVWAQGLQSEAEIKSLQLTYGKCLLNVPIPSVWKILISEILHPLYMFQIVSVIVWLLAAYYYFCLAIFFMVLSSIISELLLTRKHFQEARAMALYTCNIKVHRKGQVKIISSEELVPGDVFEVPLAKRMPCDAVIISGSCMVNESMLTGESMPILKSPIPKNDSLYNPEVNTLHSLYEGTEVTDF